MHLIRPVCALITFSIYDYIHCLDLPIDILLAAGHRDGTIAQTAKGNLFKGPFHLPRQEWYCRQLLEEALQ